PQGEQCAGDALGGATCASLSFASGTLTCTQCHFDTSRCSLCGDGVINAREQCDGADLGGRTCAALGFTGGTLTCTPACRLSTRSCDPTFFVPGGGPPGPECLAEWRVANALGRPGAPRPLVGGGHRADVVAPARGERALCRPGRDRGADARAAAGGARAARAHRGRRRAPARHGRAQARLRPVAPLRARGARLTI